MNNWIPIETAPKDGTPILLGCFDLGNSWAQSDMWDHHMDRWLNSWRCAKKLTHWAHLPELPTEEGEE